MSRIAIRVPALEPRLNRARRPGRGSGLWAAALITAAVLLGPLAVSWSLVADGAITSVWASVVLGTVLSLVAWQLAGLWWERNRQSSDLLFSDLLLWGWIRRRSMQRRLANAARLFPPATDALRHFPPTTNTARRFPPATQAPGTPHLCDPLALLRRLAADLEATDPYTHGHSRRVARYASLIARGMDLPPADVRKIRLAAALHDIGKLHTPRAILETPRRLTDEEFAVVKRHPDDGADMIQKVIDDPELVAIVRHHHERMDGNGYPRGLAAEEIPLGARIIAVADTFDAITSKRSYHPSRPHKAALDIMRSEAGAQLDPNAVRAFRSAYFGRRWLWIPAGAVNAGGRLLAGAIAHVADSAAIAAGTAALATTSLLAPMAQRTAPAFTPPAHVRSGAVRNGSLTALTVRGALGPGGTAVTPTVYDGPQRGQPQGFRLTSLARRPGLAPGTPHGTTSPLGSAGATSGRPVAGSSGGGSGTPPSQGPVGGAGGGRTGSPSGGSGTPPSQGPVGGAGGGHTVSVAGTTATLSSTGSTVTTTVPVAPATGASAAASSGTISVSGSAVGSSVGVTVTHGLPAASLSVPGLPAVSLSVPGLPAAGLSVPGLPAPARLPKPLG